MTARTPAAILFLSLPAATHAFAAPVLDPSRLAAISPPPGARAPMRAEFRDQSGRAVTLGQLAAGRPLVLAPVQHDCRNLCGLTLESLAQAIARQPQRPGRDFALVAFGIDPHETPAQAMASLRRLGGAGQGGVSALVGGPAQVAAVTSALGYRYSWMPVTRQYAHLSAIAVLAPDGRLEAWLPGLGETPGALDAALAKARAGAPYSLGDRIRLLCFHFDPTTGRYTLTILTVLRLFAAAVALALAAGVAAMLWRARRREAS